MPIKPLILQRRHAELGRIRLGNQVTGANGRSRPNKLAAFRFTSPSQRYIADLATLYGGDPKPWDNNGVSSWEVFTDATSMPVIAVKGGLSQWLETWSGGGCIHRCDGELMVDGRPCDQDTTTVKVRVDGREAEVLAHDAAKPTTRLSVMLPELEAIGVWRLESHGWNAAAEIPAVAELAQYVGDLVPANLHLVERRSVKDGKTSRFVVPVLDLQIGTARLREIVNQASGAGELTAGPAAVDGQPAAIETGPVADPYVKARELVADATTLDELAAIWDQGREAGVLGSKAPASPEMDSFVAAWKARAHEIKAAQAEPAKPAESPLPKPLPDGSAPEDATDPDGDPEVVWQQVLAAAGDLEPSMSLQQVLVDFQDRYGMAASVATAGELQHYLDALKGAVAA